MKEIVLVTGEGCSGCDALEPVARKTASDKGVPLRRIEANASGAAEIARLKVERVPTLLVMDGEKEIARCCGYQPEEILSLWLDAKLQ